MIVELTYEAGPVVVLDDGTRVPIPSRGLIVEYRGSGAVLAGIVDVGETYVRCRSEDGQIMVSYDLTAPGLTVWQIDGDTARRIDPARNTTRSGQR